MEPQTAMYDEAPTPPVTIEPPAAKTFTLKEEVEHLRFEVEVARRRIDHLTTEATQWMAKYYQTQHYLHQAHLGLERYSRRLQSWREERAALVARLGMRERRR